MTELTEDQTERARELYESYSDRVQKHEGLYENGHVGEALTSFFSGLAGKYEKIGILQVHLEGVADAQASFDAAAENYLASAAAYAPELSAVSTRSLLKAIVTGALAGNGELVETSVEHVLAIHRNNELATDHEFADRFYLTGCLADAISDDGRSGTYSRLAEVNDVKSGSDAIYGRAILEFADGIQSLDSDRVAEAIRSMIEYHHRTRSEDNIVDLILAPEATALLILAHYAGVDVPVADEFIPASLVEASIRDMT